MEVQNRWRRKAKSKKVTTVTAGSNNSAGGANVKGHQSMKKVDWRNKVRDEHEGEED